MAGEPSRAQPPHPSPALAEPDPQVRERLDALYAAGHAASERFRAAAQPNDFHPFIPADWKRVEQCLLSHRQPDLRFLEWGSGSGVITIMASLLGFEAYGIEIDADLVDVARELARDFDSPARFAAGSLFPAGYRWRSSTGDWRLGTLGQGRPGYAELGVPLEGFDLVFAYPWSGEEPIMQDLIARRGAPGARLLMYGTHGVRIIEGGTAR